MFSFCKPDMLRNAPSSGRRIRRGCLSRRWARPPTHRPVPLDLGPQEGPLHLRPVTVRIAAETSQASWRRRWLLPRSHRLGEEARSRALSFPPPTFPVSTGQRIWWAQPITHYDWCKSDARRSLPELFFFFLACHIYYCNISIALTSIMMKFNLLPPIYPSTFWLVKGTFE